MSETFVRRVTLQALIPYRKQMIAWSKIDDMSQALWRRAILNALIPYQKGVLETRKKEAERLVMARDQL